MTPSVFLNGITDTPGALCGILFDYTLQLRMRIEGAKVFKTSVLMNTFTVNSTKLWFSWNTHLLVLNLHHVFVPGNSWKWDLVWVGIREWAWLFAWMAEFKWAEVALQQNVWRMLPGWCSCRVCVTGSVFTSAMCHNCWKSQHHQAEVSNPWWGDPPASCHLIFSPSFISSCSFSPDLSQQ